MPPRSAPRPRSWEAAAGRWWPWAEVAAEQARGRRRAAPLATDSAAAWPCRPAQPERRGAVRGTPPGPAGPRARSVRRGLRRSGRPTRAASTRWRLAARPGNFKEALDPSRQQQVATDAELAEGEQHRPTRVAGDQLQEVHRPDGESDGRFLI